MSPNLTGLILLIASAGAVFGLINPQYRTFQDLAEKGKVYNNALDQAIQVRDGREKLIASNIKISEDDKALLNKLLPDSVDTVRLVMDLNGIASKYGIVIRKIDLNQAEKQQGKSQNQIVVIGKDQSLVDELPLSFSLSTSYQNFIRFLDDLEVSLRIIDVTSISVSPSTSGTGAYDFTVTAKTYSLK